MKLLLNRYKNNGDTTTGVVKDTFFRCFTLEDEPRLIKVKGETRIPAGTYEIKERKVISPLTKKYQKIFPWFRYHLELQDVPGFKYVYIHVGNDDDDTDACILVGEKPYGWKIGQSRAAFNRIYHYIMGSLMSNARVYITITDEE